MSGDKNVPGRPKADLRHPGKFLPMTRETDPGNFHDAEGLKKATAGFWAAWDRCQAKMRKPNLGEDIRKPFGLYDREHEGAYAASEVDDDELYEVEIDDNDESGDYAPESGVAKSSSKSKGKGKTKAAAKKGEDDESWRKEIPSDLEDEEDLEVDENTEVTEEDVEGDEVDDGEEAGAPNAAALADVLDVNDPGWKRGTPKSLPLTYYVPSDAIGGLKIKTIKFDVDFNRPELVNKANKTRRLEVNRAKQRHGITGPLKRPSTRGREYTQENQDAIKDIYDDWATHNGGVRIPIDELTVLYNRAFPGENRTKHSLTSHIDRIPELKDKRNSYPAK